MKTFNLFCENVRSADLFWDCAKIMHEAQWEPVHFTIGMMEVWSERETDLEKRDFLIETLKICDEEILLEVNPFADRFNRGVERGVQRNPGNQAGYRAGQAAGWGAEKAGQVGGWLKNQWRDMKGSFMQGAGGGSHDPNAYANPQAQTQATSTATDQSGTSNSGVDVQRVAQYFDELMSMVQRAGMGQDYIGALQGLRDQLANGGSQSAAAAARTGTASSGSGSLADYQRSREAGAATANGEPDAYQRHASLRGDIDEIQRELDQAQAAGDTREVQRLQTDLDRYKRKASRARSQVTRQANKDVATDTAGYEFM